MPRQDQSARKPAVLLRKAIVRSRVGLSDRTITRRVALGTFPRPVWIAPHIPAWREQDVIDWIDQRPDASTRTRG